MLACLVAALVATGVPGVAGGETRAEGGEIDGCTTIDAPGRYELTTDIRNADGQCIRIRASDVTLVGNGHVVGGTGAFGTAGITAGTWGGPVSNVTVMNVTAARWDDGIRYTNVDGGAILGVRTERNRVGILLLSSSNNTLRNDLSVGNAVHGVSLVDSSDRNKLRDVTARENGLYGVHLVAGTGNSIRTTTATDNEFGIVLIDAHDNELVNDSATGNRIAGVWLAGSRDNELAETLVTNRFYGVMLTDGADGNRIADNTARRNAVGIRLRSSDGNAIAGNAVTNNEADGVLVIASNGTRIVDNRVVDNLRGITLLDSDDTLLRGNVLKRNEGAGITIERGSENATSG